MHKKYSYSKVSKFLACGIAAIALATSGGGALASDFVFDLTNVGSTPASVQVTVHQQNAQTLRFTVDQNDPNKYGDLRGLLFHINEPIISLNDLNFTFVSAVQNMTNASFTPTMTPDLSLNSGNFDGLKNYDVLVEFGTNGIGRGDDIARVTFDVASIGGHLDLNSFLPVNMKNFMAARVTSSYDGKDREGSSKLVCCGETDVPEPSAMGLLALAFGAFGGLLWRRRKRI